MDPRAVSSQDCIEEGINLVTVSVEDVLGSCQENTLPCTMHIWGHGMGQILCEHALVWGITLGSIERMANRAGDDIVIPTGVY